MSANGRRFDYEVINGIDLRCCFDASPQVVVTGVESPMIGLCDPRVVTEGERFRDLWSHNAYHLW
jgi:hypothetical protein